MGTIHPNNSVMTSILVAVLLTVSVMSILMATHLYWAWRKIHSHPHVEHLDAAIPKDVASCLRKIVTEISNAADINPPDIYVCRAQLPNAFTVASIMRTELFLTDELLEEANNQSDRLNYLLHVFCHEIAHIKNNDSIRLGMLHYLKNMAEFLRLGAVETKCVELISSIESKAASTASRLFEEVSVLLHRMPAPESND